MEKGNVCCRLEHIYLRSLPIKELQIVDTIGYSETKIGKPHTVPCKVMGKYSFVSVSVGMSSRYIDMRGFSPLVVPCLLVVDVFFLCGGFFFGSDFDWREEVGSFEVTKISGFNNFQFRLGGFSFALLEVNGHCSIGRYPVSMIFNLGLWIFLLLWSCSAVESLSLG